MNAGPALAQQGDDSTIIVQAQSEPVTIRQAQRQAQAITQRAGSFYETPLARVERRLCPGIIGMETEAAGLLIDRIRFNAEDLGIRILPDGCRANFIIAFVEDSEQTMRDLMRGNPGQFQYMRPRERRELLEPGPVHVWTQIQPRTFDGQAIGQTRDLANPPAMRANGAHSRIYVATRRDIESVTVLFDRQAVRGLNLVQLADYASMRGFAQTQPADDLEVDSILTLFALARDNPDWAPPQAMTDFDRAYLRAVYEGIPNLPAIRKILRVGSEMRDLEEEAAQQASPAQ